MDIDLSDLKRRYLDVQRRCHPDRATNACDEVAGEAWAAWASRAYAVLRDPIRRAAHLYLLKCGNSSVEQQESEDTDSGLSQDELARILELRETVAESTSTEQIALIRRDCEAALQADMDVLRGAFRRDDCGSARHLLNRIRYWQTLKEACDQKIES